MELQLQPEIDRSEALHRIREHWLARVRHDLRGPLFAARGYARLILESAVTVTERKYAASILENLERLAALVNAMGEPPSGAALDLEPVDLRELLESAIREIEGQVTLRPVIALADSIWTVADGAKLSTAVHKLLTSLVDFSRPRARIHLKAAQEDDEVVVRCQASEARTGADTPRTADAGIEPACRILELHGGTASAGADSSGMAYVTFRIPVIPPVR